MAKESGWIAMRRGGGRAGGAPGGGARGGEEGAEGAGEDGEDGEDGEEGEDGEAGEDKQEAALLLRPLPLLRLLRPLTHEHPSNSLLRTRTSRCSRQVVSFCRSRSTTSDGARETNCSLPSFRSCDSTR